MSAIKAIEISSTGIENITESSFDLYPNPADEVLNATKGFAGKVELSIISSQSIKVFVSEFVGLNTEIDIKGFQSGVYFIQLNSDQVSGVKRVVIR